MRSNQSSFPISLLFSQHAKQIPAKAMANQASLTVALEREEDRNGAQEEEQIESI
jgi:hypothetical protein